MGKIVEKVVIVKVKTTKNVEIKELDLPIINKYLEEGYEVKNVHQISPSQSSEDVVITFVLRDNHPPR